MIPSLRKPLLNATVFPAIALFCCSCLAPILHAEGGGKRPGGDNGVNRRVRTKSKGYSEVKGTVDLSFKLPLDKSGKVSSDVLPNGEGDIPSFYLGGNSDGLNGGAEFEGGLEYQWDSHRDRSTGLTAPPGWSAYLSHNGPYTNPHVYDKGLSKPWRSKGLYGTGPFKGHGTGRIVSDLRFMFQDPGTGAVTLYISAMPASEIANMSRGISFFYNLNSSPQFQKASPAHPVVPWVGDTDIFTRRYSDVSHANVKRVVAVTREAPEKTGYDHL